MIAIIDVSHSFHKSFFIFSKWGDDLSTEKGQGRLMRKVVTDLFASVNKFYLKPEDVYFCFDEHTWRKQYSTDYKSDRSSRPEEFYTVINTLYQLMIDKGYKAFKSPGAEADDCMSFLSNVLNQEKLIVSGDEDLHQLIDPMTYVWNNNLKKPILFSKEKLTSLVLDMKYENQIVNPEFVLFKKIMLGCNGDRVQPLLNRKGIGEKTLLKFWERNYSVNPYLSLSVKVLKKDVLFYFDFEREDFESVFKSNLKLVNLEPTIFPQEVQSGLVEVFSKIMDLEPKSKYEMSELLTGTKFFKEI